MKFVGASIGAIVAPILLLLFVALAVGPGSASGSGLLMALTLAVMPVVCIAGAIAGARIVGARRRGDTRRVQMIAGVTLAIILVLPALLLAVRLTMTRPETPATEEDREAWARTLNSGTGPYTLKEYYATALAQRLQRCSPSNRMLCESEMQTFYGDGEDSLAARFAYGSHDQGWRWTKEQGRVRRYSIFPDPRLGRRGPVFEVWGPDILRHETRGAPATYPDSGVSLRLAFPQCLADFAQDAGERGIWDRTAASLPQVIADGWSPPPGCPGVELYRPPDDDVPAYDVRSQWEFRLVGPGVNHTRFRLRPDTSNATTPFRYTFDGGSRRGFTREADGSWTMESMWDGGFAGPEIPPCFFHVGMACPELRSAP